MAPRHRLTIRSIDPDPRAAAVATAAEQLGLPIPHPEQVAVADVVFLEGELDQDALSRLHGFLVDPLLQKGSWSSPTGEDARNASSSEMSMTSRRSGRSPRTVSRISDIGFPRYSGTYSSPAALDCPST